MNHPIDLSGKDAFRLLCPKCRKGLVTHNFPVCADCGFSCPIENRILILENAPTSDYSQEGAGVLAEVNEAHFWFKARNRIIVDALNRYALPDEPQKLFVDYGCGNGFVMAALEDAGWVVAGIDMHLGGLRIAGKRTQGPLYCGRFEHIRFHAGRSGAGAIGFFDVLEHLDDDHAALRHGVSQLQPRGLALVTVPALMSLWSEYDEIGGHKRRYSRNGLESLLKDAGLEVLELRYAFSFAVIPIWLQRNAVRKACNDKPDIEKRRRFARPPNPALNNMFSILSECEFKLSRIGIKPCIGTSLIGVARLS